MPPKKSNTLTEAELRLMKILWRRGESAVTDLVAALPEGEQLAYNSVLTTIRILEQKGYVEHRQEGRAFVYRPCVAEQEASRSEVRNVLSRFFGNSREQLVLSLLGDEEISAEELDRLKEAIRSAAPDTGNASKKGVEIRMPLMPWRMRFWRDLPQLRACATFAGVCASRRAGGRGGAVAGRGGCASLWFSACASLRASLRRTALRLGRGIRGCGLACRFLPFARTFRRCERGRGACDSGPQGPGFELDSRWGFAIAALWLAASAFRAAELAFHSLRLRRLWRARLRLKSKGIFARCSLPQLPARRIEICTTRDLDRPSVIGFFAPRILIPEWLFSRLTPGELEQVVLHEAEHLRRRDDWTQSAAEAFLVLFPLNPALAWMERRLCREREMACDEGVVRRTQAPRAYAACLASLAERGTAAAGIPAPRAGTFAGRIRAAAGTGSSRAQHPAAQAERCIRWRLARWSAWSAAGWSLDRLSWRAARSWSRSSPRRSRMRRRRSSRAQAATASAPASRMRERTSRDPADAVHVRAFRAIETEGHDSRSPRAAATRSPLEPRRSDRHRRTARRDGRSNANARRAELVKASLREPMAELPVAGPGIHCSHRLGRSPDICDAELTSNRRL